MSVLNQSGEEQVECPLCMEPLEVDDLHFYPCTCGYQICRFCWNRIREGENGLCPACRKAYPENPADFTPLSQEQVAAIKTEKKAREAMRRNKTLESRRALANVRVVQNNLVFVVGLPVRLADPEILKRQEYFGKYGKIHKVVINQSTTYAGSQGPSASAYVTYVSMADALRAIQGVNNVTLDGRVLKGSLGTTKYCANFMKNQPCPKPDCMYLHELGDPKASFTKEEMHAGLHQVYERKLHNQLLASARDGSSTNNTSGNSSTNADKSNTKDGNPSNFIPTTVVTSSHINNVVNSSKPNKKDQSSTNGTSTSNGITNSIGHGNSNSTSSSHSSSSSSSASNGSGKDAWPSLGSSPPGDSPARKLASPKPHSQVKSQENGTSESSSPTQMHTQPPAQMKNKDTDKPSRNKESQKKSKSDKQKKGNSNNEGESETDKPTQVFNSTSHSVYAQYLFNELDELESDRHSLLENHDLLDHNDHSLLDDDTHNLLSDTNKEVLMLQRHRDMLAGLVDNNHMMPMKPPMVNGYLLDRDISYLSNDRQINQLNQLNQGLMEQKEMLLRERNRSEMIMRQNEMLARHNAMVEPKHYMPTSSIGLESATELLGANYHPNHNMLPPFGMRVDNSMSVNSMGANSMGVNSMAANSNSMGNSMVNSMGGSSMGGFMVPGGMMPPAGLPNGFDAPMPSSEGRYLAENMDKFFTDFHKAQQMRLMLSVGQAGQSGQTGQGREERRYLPPRDSRQQEHKQRMSALLGTGAARCAGDGDDDLDFDPFKETQKALAEMMETELMQNSVSSGDNMERVRRARLPPPGFGPAGYPQRPQTHQGYNTHSTMFSDWTQMDPAIVSTSVAGGGLSAQQHELLARWRGAPGGMGAQGGLGAGPARAGRGPWATYVPLPPGFAPAKPSQPAECIDAK